MPRVDMVAPGVVEVVADEALINSVQDFLDLVANSEATSFVLHEQSIAPGFFDLRTGLAGEILQKVSTYGLRVAIVGDFAKYPSKSLQAFIVESNRGRQVFFVESRSAALAALRR